jgi:hypothetical protein
MHAADRKSSCPLEYRMKEDKYVHTDLFGWQYEVDSGAARLPGVKPYST